MSAITGILYRYGRSVNPEQIKKMNDKLVHRGLDGSKTWCEGSVAFGHQMLFTTPESIHEKLPFVDNETGLIITADARIDNRKELSKILDLENNEITSDSQFILKAYEKWGEDCPKQLLGDFAFAIWNSNTEELFCARDHMGVKPFYYHYSENSFYFATEIKALLSVVEIPKEINKLRVGYHLIPINERELTFYQNIFRLPAAHFISIKNDSLSKKCYWCLDPNLEIKMDSIEDYYLKFREIFSEAIKCRIRTNYGLGCELSGGIDSSSVVGMVKKNLTKTDENINTFSLIFNQIKDVDESYYIHKVIETGNIKPHFLISDEISPLNDIETIMGYMDEPFESPNLSMIWQLYKLAHDNDTRVILSGHDGDSLFYKGQNYFRELFTQYKWFKLSHELNSFSQRSGIPKYKIFVDRVLFPIFPKLEDFYYKFKKIRHEKDFVNINQNFVNQWNLKEKYLELDLNQYRNANNSKKTQLYYLTSPVHQYIYEMLDKLSAPWNIELRHPLSDKRLIEFCYGVPTEIKYIDGWGRVLARHGLSELLPEEVRWRQHKVNFFKVFERNLLLYDKQCLDKLLFNNSSLTEFVNINQIKKMYYRYQCGNDDADPLDIWKTAILSIWLNNNQSSSK